MPARPWRMASSGLTMSCWISSGVAPGLDTMTLAAGTTIEGFSSRGVTRNANTPARKAKAMISSVSLLSMK